MNVAYLRTLWPTRFHGQWMEASYEPGLVSVIIPTFNRAAVLGEALESVREQTHRPIELIIVDDGSTDSTQAVIDEWRRRHSDGEALTLRVLSQKNAGAPSARNLGLGECRGEYVQFLDSDDLLHPKKLETQVRRLIADRQADFVYSGTASFTTTADWNAAPFAGLPPSGQPPLVVLLGMRGSWNTISGVYRRRACQAIGPWNEQAPILQDWDYNLRFLLGDPRVAYLSGVLSLHRWTPEGRVTTSRHGETSLRGMYVLQTAWAKWIKAAGRLDEQTAEILANLLFGVALDALLRDHVRLSREVVDSMWGLSLIPSWRRNFVVYSVLAHLPGHLGPRSARLLRRPRRSQPRPPLPVSR